CQPARGCIYPPHTEATIYPPPCAVDGREGALRPAEASDDRFSGSACLGVRHRGARFCSLPGSSQASSHRDDADVDPGLALGRAPQRRIGLGDAMAGARVASPGDSARSLPVGRGDAHYTLLRDGADKRTLVDDLRGDLTPMAGLPLPRLRYFLIRSPYPVVLAAAAAVMAAVVLVAPPAQAPGPRKISAVGRKGNHAEVKISSPP